MADMDTSSLKVEWGSVTMNSASVPKSPTSSFMGYNSVNAADMVIGRILWLPSRGELPQDVVQQVHPRAEVGTAELYNHPVVICSRNARERVHFFIITSFSGRSLEERFGPNPHSKVEQKRISCYLPIWPSQHHPRSHVQENGFETPTMILEGSKKLLKNSYINTSTAFAIDYLYLRPYGALFSRRKPKFCLDENSAKAMLSWSKKISQYTPGPQFHLWQPLIVRPRLKEWPTTEGETRERPETPPVVPAEVGTKCPFLILLKALVEAPRTAYHELRFGSLQLGLAIGLVAIVISVLKVLSIVLHTILKFGYWGIRRAVLFIPG